MKFSDLVSVSGMSGLFQLLGTKSDGAIVKNFDEDKNIFISARKHEVTPLDSIEVYTQTDNIRLKEVFVRFIENEHKVESTEVYKESAELIKKTFEQLLPEYDPSRVHIGDMKKMLKWFGILKKLDLLKDLKSELEQEEKESTEKVEE